MTGYKGRNMTLKLGTGGSATIITQARTHGMTLNNELVDITNKDSNGFRTLLEDAGLKSLELTIEGIVDNTTSFEEFQGNAFANTLDQYRLEFGDSDAIEGLFQISNYTINGPTGTEQTFSATLASSGQWTLTAA